MSYAAAAVWDRGQDDGDEVEQGPLVRVEAIDLPQKKDASRTVRPRINVDAVLQDWYIPQTPAAMASSATQEVQALKPYGIETYEVLNEPNGCAYQLSAANYTAMLKATYKAVKAADPSATVISGGMCPNGATNSPPTYLSAMYKAGALLGRYPQDLRVGRVYPSFWTLTSELRSRPQRSAGATRRRGT